MIKTRQRWKQREEMKSACRSLKGNAKSVIRIVTINPFHIMPPDYCQIVWRNAKIWLSIFTVKFSILLPIKIEQWIHSKPDCLRCITALHAFKKISFLISNCTLFHLIHIDTCLTVAVTKEWRVVELQMFHMKTIKQI